MKLFGDFVEKLLFLGSATACYTEVMTRFLFAILIALSLSACAVYVTPEPAPSTSVRVRPLPNTQPEIAVTDVSQISTFVPTRGERSVYGLDESISFRVLTTGDGYLTLTAYGPDGVASVFAQGIYVEGGVVTYLPSAESGVSYDLGPPRGLQRVTATLSSDPGGSAVQDIAETTFYIQ